MARRGKKYLKIREQKKFTEFTLENAIKEIKKLTFSKFVGSAELHLAVNLPKDKDAKSIKGSVSLPYASGKEKTVYVFTSPENVKKAESAGADKVGLEELVKEIKDGKIDFDVAIATPDVMAKIAVLGKELGQKGLMPNPKTGTVASVEKLEETIKAFKKGKLTFSADAQGGIHMGVGKLDLTDEKIIENINVAIKAIEEIFGKPFHQFIKRSFLSSTMGVGIKVAFKKTEE